MVEERHNGDWQELWRQYGARLLLFARQQAAAEDDAEDVVQDAFVRFWKARERNPDLPTPLLFTYVRRVAIDRARKWRGWWRRWGAPSPDLEPSVAVFDTALESRERQALLESSLNALPAAQREVLVLKIWGDLTFEEIGQTLEISANTAASRYRYALERLRTLLTPSLS